MVPGMSHNADLCTLSLHTVRPEMNDVWEWCMLLPQLLHDGGKCK